MKDKWTADAVYGLLGGLFPSPAYVLLPQVRNGTGMSRATTRIADAIAASVWPSRGMYLVGIEIKVSLSDWKKEIADPHKSAEMQKYCTHWYIAAPKGLVPGGTLPKAWGLIECTRTRATITTKAPELTPVPVDTPLLCAVLRAASTVMVPKCEQEDLEQRIRDSWSKGYEEAKEHVENYELKKLKAAVCKFEKASGISIGQEWNAGRIGEAVMAFMNLNPSDVVERFVVCEQELERVLRAVRGAKAAIEDAK